MRIGAVEDLQSVAVAVGVRDVRIRAVDIGFVVVEQPVVVAVGSLFGRCLLRSRRRRRWSWLGNLLWDRQF
jgi:hypothetical protein